jgi:hypothetical protein
MNRINKGVGHETAISTYSNTYKEYQHDYLSQTPYHPATYGWAR